jgi:hypothetical protein
MMASGRVLACWLLLDSNCLVGWLFKLLPWLQQQASCCCCVVLATATIITTTSVGYRLSRTLLLRRRHMTPRLFLKFYLNLSFGYEISLTSDS